MRTWTYLAVIGLLAGCGPKVADNAAEPVNATNDSAAIANAAAGNEAAAVPANAAEAQPMQAGAAVRGLPLRTGFYVSSDTACANASNATLMLVRRDGYNGARYSCDFKTVEKTDATSYRVTEQCSELGGFGGDSPEPWTSTVRYEVPNDSRFTARQDDGSASAARYCPQSSLPEPWRDNDISDIVK